MSTIKVLRLIDLFIIKKSRENDIFDVMSVRYSFSGFFKLLVTLIQIKKKNEQVNKQSHLLLMNIDSKDHEEKI
jgi:hypothetical protein